MARKERAFVSSIIACRVSAGREPRAARRATERAPLDEPGPQTVAASAGSSVGLRNE